MRVFFASKSKCAEFVATLGAAGLQLASRGRIYLEKKPDGDLTGISLPLRS
jgi:hypothetical protein